MRCFNKNDFSFAPELLGAYLKEKEVPKDKKRARRSNSCKNVNSFKFNPTRTNSEDRLLKPKVEKADLFLVMEQMPLDLGQLI